MFDLQKMTIYELRKYARKLGLTPLVRKKAELIEMIEKQLANPTVTAKSRRGRPPSTETLQEKTIVKVTENRQNKEELVKLVDGIILKLQKLKNKL